MQLNPLLEIPRGLQEMEKLDKEKEDNANTVVHQAEKSEFQVIDLNDLD